jgi:hypothetical protein
MDKGMGSMGCNGRRRGGLVGGGSQSLLLSNHSLNWH